MDLTPFLPLAATPSTLVDAIDLTLTHGTMPASMKQTIVNAVTPAAVAGGNVETSQRIVDVLLRALANVIPERIPAASSGTMNNLTKNTVKFDADLLLQSRD